MEKENLNKLLLIAARDNDLEVAKLLIEKGADVKAKHKDGETPLHEAAEHNSVEVIELLKKHGGK